MDETNSVEVKLNQKGDGEAKTAVIEGKTSVPFGTFAKMVGERKLSNLIKGKSKEPVIVGTDLLTDLANAPQDNRENLSKLVTVTFCTGLMAGIFAFALFEFIISALDIELTRGYYGSVVVIFALIGLLVHLMIRMRARQKSDKLTETMEKVTSVLSK